MMADRSLAERFGWCHSFWGSLTVLGEGPPYKWEASVIPDGVLPM